MLQLHHLLPLRPISRHMADHAKRTGVGEEKPLLFATELVSMWYQVKAMVL